MKIELPRGLTQHHSNTSWRWTPTPARRDRGWKSATLKHSDGSNMTMGQAVDAATAINALVDACERGEDITGRPWSHLNPGAATYIPVAAGPEPDSIGVLIDRWQQSHGFLSKRPTTRTGYAQSLKQLVDHLAGHPDGRPKKKEGAARYEAAVATIRASTVDAFFVDEQLLPDKYRAMVKAGKVSLANHMMSVTQIWLNWVIKDQKHLKGKSNPVDEVERVPSPGRVVVWTRDEEAEFLKTAVDMGWQNIAWAVELALELSWSQIDILALTWGQLKTDKPTGHMRMKGTRSKTGNMTHTTLTANGRDIIARMKAAWHAEHGDTVEPSPSTPMLVVDAVKDRADKGAVGQPWNADYFRHTFMAIKKQCRPVITNTFQDLRDTAITRMKEAGLTDHEIQSRTQHSLTQIRAILDKHYGMTTLEISDAAADKLNAKSV